MKNIIFKLSAICLLLLSTSCETTDLGLSDNPNNKNRKQAANDLSLSLNNLQVSFAKGLYKFNEPAMENIRMISLFGAYTGPFSEATPAALNDNWRDIYFEVIPTAEFIIQEGKARKLNYHVAIAQTLEAYTLINLVDFYAKAPFSEANKADKASKIKNPKLDDGQKVYQKALELLTEAETNFSGDALGVKSISDLFYNADPKKWIKLINSIRLKIYVQTRLITPAVSKTEINKIIASGNYIKDPADDFVYPYTTNNANPDNRHPEYKDNYNEADDYMSNYLIFIMKDEKKNPDPRLRYYIYRQTNKDPSGDDLPCEGKKYPYCYLGDGYWARDHADNEGVPPDGLRRATWGVYPAGGAFDNDSFESVRDNPGAGGAGIFPLLLSSYINFMLAEASLTLGTQGDAKTYFETGIRQSIQKVENFGAKLGANTTGLKITGTDKYIKEANEAYDKASNKLDAVIKEYLIASFGNGIEPYNNYRRTGFPSDIEAPVTNAGPFPLSNLYPTDASNSNVNISSKSVTERVFWDTGKHKLN